MRINLQVSLIALLITMGSLSQPSWSMEKMDTTDDQDVHRAEKRKERDDNNKDTKEDNEQPPKRKRKFNRKRQVPPIGFNDLPWELQARIWAYALAEKDPFAYDYLSRVSKSSRAYTQDPNVLGEALNLCIFEPRIAWDQEQDEQDKKNKNQAQENQVQSKQEQDKENPIVSKFLALKKAPYKKPSDYEKVAPISTLLTAMRYTPNSHALVYHLATYLHDVSRDIEKIAPFADLKSLIIQMQKTKSFLVSGLLEDREKGRPLDSLKYEAFLKLFYVLRNQQDYINENNIPKIGLMEEKYPLEKETDSIRKEIKIAYNHNNFNKFKLYNFTQLRLIALLDDRLKSKHYHSLLEWLASQGDLEALRCITDACRPVFSCSYETEDVPHPQLNYTYPDEQYAHFWYSQILDDKNHPLYTEAQYGLGMLYLKRNKQSLIPNDAKGIRLLQEAAEAGEPLACLEMGRRYITGSLSILKQNITLGTEWLEKAARLGNPSGLYYLFEIYAKGRVIPRDQEKAEAYLAKALERNDKSAIREKEIRGRQRVFDLFPVPPLSLHSEGTYPMDPDTGLPTQEDDQQRVHMMHLPITLAQPVTSVFSEYDPQADTNNPGIRQEEDPFMSSDLFEKVDELFHIPEEDSELVDVSQEYYDNFMKEVSGNSSEKPFD
ncbi:MAG: hypothetical protein BGO67_06520 [Alphaproteobacteria bacterium 41-28]|nr:MAG: hypothetical protein BGO67_06520 [Alphaproteobacteria bacterium 41-28]